MTMPMSSPPSPSRFSVIVPLIVGCAQFMHQFDGTMITTALPVMAVSLNEDPLKLNLAITCYLLALAVFVPISGWMADRYGARRVFLAAIAVFTASSVLCGLSGTLAEIVLWRTVQGIGGAMMTPVGRVIVVKSVPRLEIVRAMNYVTIPAVLAPLIGPSVGGFIVTYFSWPWIFFLNLPIGIAGLFLVYIYVPDIREDTVAPLDLRGFVLIGLALAGLVFGFAALGRGALPTEVIIASISVGAICGALYLAHAQAQIRSDHRSHAVAQPHLRGVDLRRRAVLHRHHRAGVPDGAAAAGRVRLFRLPRRPDAARGRDRLDRDALHAAGRC